MSSHSRISLFVLAWMLLFHYETLRLNYLSPLFGRELPKFKFLYPPAGWIMFFNVDRSYGFAEVYGLRDGPPGPSGSDDPKGRGLSTRRVGDQPVLIDPHEIFRTRFVWYDNIRRNVLISVLSANAEPNFCPYLHWRFPQYESFAVLYRVYPDVVEKPNETLYQVAYRCPAVSP